MDNTSKKLFKTSVIGGFNREDVAAYIEYLTNQHVEEMQEIRNQLKAAAAQNITAKEQNDALAKAKAELETRVAELTQCAQDREEIFDMLQNAQGENERMENKLAEAEEKISTLQREHDKMTKRIAGYVSMEQELNKSKEHIADLELDALRRAAEVEDAARARMQEEIEKHRAEMKEQEQELIAYRENSYSEVEDMVADISSAYLRVKSAVGGFKTGFKEVVSDLAKEIDTISDACSLVEQSFGDLCQKCTAMRETCGLEPQEDEAAEMPEQEAAFHNA